MIRNKQDFWSGILFLGFGLFFAFFAREYNMGTPVKMGPGYFPFYLGVLLTTLGAYISLRALPQSATQTHVESFDLKTIGLILGGVISFGVLLQPLGLYIALLSLIFISSLASHQFSIKSTAINALVLITLCYVVFVKALSLQFPLYPKFLGL